MIRFLNSITLLSLLQIFLPHSVIAQTRLPEVTIDDNKLKYELGWDAEVLRDPTHKLTLSQLVSGKYDKQFEKKNKAVWNLGYSTDDVWIRLKIKNNSSRNSQWLIEVGNLYLDVAEIFLLDENEITTVKSNKHTPLDQRLINTRDHLLPLVIPNGEERIVYIHTVWSDNRFYQLNLWEKDEYLHDARITDVWLALFYAVLIALAVYNLFLFISIRDRSYLYYVIYIAATCTSQMISSGFAIEYIGFPMVTGELGLPILSFLIFSFAAGFSFSFLNIQYFYPKLHKVTVITIGSLLLCTSLQYLPASHKLASDISLYLQLLIALLNFSFGIISLRKGYRPARYYMIGWSVLLIGVIIFLLKNMGYVPITPFTQNIIKWCLCFEAIILSLGLADRLHTTTVQLKLKTLESKQLAESEKAKSDFFNNISHELRTPLSLIISPLEKMLQENNKPAKDLLTIMHRNASRLLQLVNQLLDLSKLDSKFMTLNYQEGDVVNHIKVTVSTFESVAAEKSISLNLHLNTNSHQALFDRDKIETILTNLLSNAIKFTPIQGTVTVTIEVENGNLQMIVTDSGIGIATDQLDKIFDRFYQVNQSSTTEYGGTGIGLSLVKELVKLQRGDIHVSSEINQGTIFTVTIPIKSIWNGTSVAHHEEITTPSLLPSESKNSNGHGDHSIDTKPVLLLVEDNDDFRAFTKSIFSKTYDVIEATNGIDGWEKASSELPDLIISDIMMPHSDGTTLCKQIKEDVRTSHIPIILLTARQGMDSKLKGLETGADDYIGKPFHADELKARVKNLLTQRDKLKLLYQNRNWPHLQTKELNANEKFLKMITDAIEANISSGEIGVEQLSKEIGISRAQFFKKLKALTGQSPSDFIRIYKLNKAAHLLDEQIYEGVADVGYACGFNSASHFAESFKKHFGTSPTSYLKK